MDTKERLVYLLADLLDQNIYLVAGEYRAHTDHKFDLGGKWVLPSAVTVCVDECTDKLVTAFMKIRRNLWAYVVITETGKWLLFFDNDRVKIRPGGEKEFGKGNGMGTLKRLKPSITGAVSFAEGQWRTTNPDVLIGDL